jgi:DNA-binding MarR family transcriptional regulator
MVRLSWVMKRAYYACWAQGRKWWRMYWSDHGTLTYEPWLKRITPARVDLLRCLDKHGGTMMQDAARVALGVVRSVVSETLAVLEKLGWVTRGRRRQAGRTVTLTARGKDALLHAWIAQFELEAELLGALDDDEKNEDALEGFCRAVCRDLRGVTPMMLYDNLEYID